MSVKTCEVSRRTISILPINRSLGRVVRPLSEKENSRRHKGHDRASDGGLS